MCFLHLPNSPDCALIYIGAWQVWLLGRPHVSWFHDLVGS